MARDEERLRRAEQEPIVGGLPDWTGGRSLRPGGSGTLLSVAAGWTPVTVEAFAFFIQ